MYVLWRNLIIFFNMMLLACMRRGPTSWSDTLGKSTSLIILFGRNCKKLNFSFFPWMVWVKNKQKSKYLLTYYKLHQIYCMHDGHWNSRYQMMMNQRIYDLMIDLGKPTIILWFEYLMNLDVVSTLCGVYSNDPKWASHQHKVWWDDALHLMMC